MTLYLPCIEHHHLRAGLREIGEGHSPFEGATRAMLGVEIHAGHQSLNAGFCVEFFIAFVNFALAMWLAWRHEAPSAVYVFFAGLVFVAALYLRHATDALPLSF